MNIFFTQDDKLLEKYYGIWNKVSKSFKERPDCKPIYNKKISKNQIKAFWL